MICPICGNECIPEYGYPPYAVYSPEPPEPVLEGYSCKNELHAYFNGDDWVGDYYQEFK